MDRLTEAIYVLLESGRIAMGAALGGILPNRGWALQADARALLPRLKAAIEACNDGEGISVNESLHLMAELNRITMGASLGGLKGVQGATLQNDALKVLPRLKQIRDFYSFG